MRKQIFKAATMFIGIMALAFVSAVAASAQNQRSLVVNVPFDFSVKGKTLPAGEYIVSRGSDAESSAMIIERKDGKASAVVLTMLVDSREMQKESRLVFNRYGDRYFLSQVWTASSPEGRKLFRTGLERSLEVELARNNARPETVAITASMK